MKLSRALVVVLVVAGCASPEAPRGLVDASPPPDFLVNDDEDLADPPDFSSSGDFAEVDPHDLGADAAPADLKTTSSDLSTVANADLATPPDLLKPNPDMVVVSTCMPPVTGGSCDTSPQCGCTNNLNCSVTDTTTGLTGCVSAGNTNNYAGCTGSGAGQCKVGSTCVDGVCQPYCQSTADCPGANRECGQVTNSSNTAIPGFTVCSQTCDPVTPTRTDATHGGCGPNIGCLPGSNRITSCFGPTLGTALQGDFCGNSLFGATAPDFSQCAPGYLCLTTTIFSTSIYSCAKFCHKASGDTDCTVLNDSSTTYHCSSFGTKQYAGTDEIGYCN